MASLLLGRITDVATLGNVERVDLTALSIDLNGKTSLGGTDRQALTAARDQMAGMADNPDEPVVPMCHVGDKCDPSLNQFVRPRTASVSVESGGLEVGRTPWSVSADRIQYGARPRLETRINGAVRTNDQTVILSDLMPWHAVSSLATGYVFDNNADTPATRTGPGGSVKFYQNAQDYLSGYPAWTIAPSDYYNMAAYIQTTGGSPSTTYRPIIGRHLDAASNLTSWKIGNGLFEIGPGTSGNALLTLTLPVYATPTGWGTPYQIEAGFIGGATWFPWAASRITNITVLRNSPEVCVLRLYVAFAPSGGTTSNVFTLDLVVRRGARGANVVIKSTSAKQWGLSYASAPVGGTADINIHAHAAGLNRVNDDANGNRMILFTAAPNLRDNTNGRLYDSAAVTSIDMGIYGEVGGTSSASPDREVDLLAQYMAAQSESRITVLP